MQNGQPSTVNGQRNKVVVAMSGGVDSSVAAALLKKQGYNVVGVTMQIWPKDLQTAADDDFSGCCSLSAVEDARKVAQKIDIPFYVLNFRDIFGKKVIDNFIAEYQRGRTPNPCIRCNQFIKFEALLTKARGLGAGYIATGHYARINFEEKSGRYLLLKGIDQKKDQSYVLYMMTQEQLKSTLFPLGGLTKNEVRQTARHFGLRVASKPESQEICFVTNDDYPQFLKQKAPGANKKGPIYDCEGKIIGSHQGIAFFTIGQRKGLGISSKEPLYVLDIDAKSNSIVAGPKRMLAAKGFIGVEPNLISASEINGKVKADVQIRYNSKARPAVITNGQGQALKVIFNKPQEAVTPGQAAVFYDGQKVIGGVTIDKSI